MSDLWQTAYDLALLPALRAGIRALAPFRPKISQGLAGRAATFAQIRRFLESGPRGAETEGGIWFHGTSVGEFLQAVPLILRLKEARPERPVWFSFFSPSVEERARAFTGCDLAFYLPEDTRPAMRELIALLRPGLVVFSKFDIWRNVITECRAAGVPTAVTAATLSPDSGRLSGLSGSFHRSFYRHLDLVCAISDQDGDSFARLGVPRERIVTTGDTRFDQTWERAAKVQPDDPLVEPFHGWGESPVFALGSTWPTDEEHLLPAVAALAASHPELRFVLVPHETTPEHLENLRRFLNGQGLSFETYSSFNAGTGNAKRVGPATRAVVVDRVGVLAAVYRAAALVYVGGSFGKGVHNVMEPACFGLPVLFGPNHLNSYEARLMLAAGGAAAVDSSTAAVDAVEKLLADPDTCKQAGASAQRVVRDNLGATGRTLHELASRFSVAAV
ncbi:hypothetical protein LLH00_07355 [bacterium]|nr:hypothetical protein [bacterium]